jgi:hypothetical protein
LILVRLTRPGRCPSDDAYLYQAFPEGSPLHPAYPSGHAVVAGACVTVLKAWFDDALLFSTLFPGGIFEADPMTNGTTLRPFPGTVTPPPTIGGELNKLASNISIARNGAGVHWRTDYLEGVRLGERIAIGLLEEQRLTYNEPHSFIWGSQTRFHLAGSTPAGYSPT